MRNIILTFSLILITISAFCQMLQSTQMTKDQYFQKSKNQKTAAWIMLGGGVALATVGSIIEANKITDDFTGSLSSSTTGPEIMVIAGIGSALGSIPLFLGSSKNLRRAASISFNNQKILVPRFNTFTLRSEPTVTLKIRL